MSSRRLAERRDEEGNDVQPVKEILAKSPGGNFVGEVLVCRGKNADVHSHGGRGADRLKRLAPRRHAVLWPES